MLLSQLEYFRVVAKYEHMTKAAEELCVAQPSLSATINRIEKELGVPLFERNGRNIKLNDVGRRLLEYAEFMQEQLAELETTLQLTDTLLKNKFTLAASNSRLLTGWLKDFILQYPEVRLQQKILSEPQMLEALQNETIDIAMGAFDTIPAGIASKTLVEDEYAVRFTEKHPLAQKEIIYFDDIRDTEIVALQSSNTQKIVDRIFAQKDCQPNIVLEGSSHLMSRYTKGISFASKQMMYIAYVAHLRSNAGAEQKGQYTAVLKTIADTDCSCNISLCWKENRELPAMVQNFIETIEQSYPNYNNDESFCVNDRIIYPIY